MWWKWQTCGISIAWRHGRVVCRLPGSVWEARFRCLNLGNPVTITSYSYEGGPGEAGDGAAKSLIWLRNRPGVVGCRGGLIAAVEKSMCPLFHAPALWKGDPHLNTGDVLISGGGLVVAGVAALQQCVLCG